MLSLKAAAMSLFGNLGKKDEGLPVKRTFIQYDDPDKIQDGRKVHTWQPGSKGADSYCGVHTNVETPDAECNLETATATTTSDSTPPSSPEAARDKVPACGYASYDAFDNTEPSVPAVMPEITWSVLNL